MWQKFTGEAQQAFYLAQQGAERRGSNRVTPEDLLAGLLLREESAAARILRALGLEAEAIRAALRESVPREAAGDEETPRLSEAAERVLEQARKVREEPKAVGTEHLLLGILRERESRAAELLRERGVTELRVREAAAGQEPDPVSPGGFTLPAWLRAHLTAGNVTVAVQGTLLLHAIYSYRLAERLWQF